MSSKHSSLSRRASRKRKNRSVSSSGRGPHSVSDHVFAPPQPPPLFWHQHPVYSRFWQHYHALMGGAVLAALGHASGAGGGGGGGCCCGGQMCTSSGQFSHLNPAPPSSAPSSRRHLCRKHRKQKHRPRGHPHPRLQRPRPQYAPHSVEEDDDPGRDTESASELTKQMTTAMHLSDREEAPLQRGRQSQWQRRYRLEEDIVEEKTAKEEQVDGMSEEFLAFLQQSIRHRQEWKLRKEKIGQQQKGGQLNGGNGILETTMETEGDDKEPKDHPDAVRTREMRVLYGDAAPRLHAMETAVQLAYDRVATRHHAKLWPNIPLNVVFGEE